MNPYGKFDVSRVDLKERRTKIVATVGPASWDPPMLAKLVAAGVDVFRLNMSHGTHEQHRTTFRRIRAASSRAGRHVGVLADLCGPKIRVGKFEQGSIELHAGEAVTVTTRKLIGRTGLIPSRYAALARDVNKGDSILLDDGKLRLIVENVRGQDVRCQVVHGGTLRDGKGINLPGVNVSAPGLTRKDRTDAKFAIGLGVDYLALSFVRKPADVLALRRLISKAGARTSIIAKIEKPEALDHIDEILEVSQAVMVARGDLGVEMPVEEVPLIQRELVSVAIEANRPVIMATQMLESMIEDPQPTRAEATDVASAAMFGADAVMLSGETAAGKYPVEAVATMDRIVRRVEGYQWKHGQFGEHTHRRGLHESDAFNPLPIHEGLSRATSQLSRALAVRAVVVPTESGRTVRWVSAERPAAPILALSPSLAVCQKASLLWGVTPVHVSRKSLADNPTLARRTARKLGLADKGQAILLVWDPNTGAAPQPTITVLVI